MLFYYFVYLYITGFVFKTELNANLRNFLIKKALTKKYFNAIIQSI